MNLHVISPIVMVGLMSMYHRVGFLFGHKG